MNSSSIYDRELEEPHEGSRTIPLPLALLMAAIACWGSYYYGAYGGDDEPSLAVAAPSVDGKKLFETRCAACHQKDGKGLAGAFPPLAGSEWVTGAPEVPTAILLHGLSGELKVGGKTYRGAMPTFKTLSDEEIAAVASYVRGGWGNGAGKVEASLVTSLREQTSARKGPWKGEAELRSFLGEKAP